MEEKIKATEKILETSVCNQVYNKDQLKHFNSIVEFLDDHRAAMKFEPLQRYPDHLKDYQSAWVEELISEGEENLYKIAAEKDYSVIKTPSLRNFFLDIEKLRKIKKRNYTASPKLNGLRLEGITAKKLHEITQISRFINQEEPEKFIDLCSGKGHLSYLMAYEHGVKSLNIDLDSEIQYSGILRNEKYLSPIGKKDYVQYKTIDFSKLNPKLIEDYNLSIGLHTCGSLAVNHIEKAIQAKHSVFLNFGCCYHRMKPSEYELSQPGKNSKLIEHKFALSLATRSHDCIPRKTYEMNNRVKYFRYIFQFYLKEKFGKDMMTVLKSSNASLYRGDFSTYANEQLRRLGLPVQNEAEQNSFFCDKTNQNHVFEILCVNAIRNALGRLIELYLLYDRAFFANEMGYETELSEFFKEDLSPRNIGIVFKKTLNSTL